MTFFKKHLNNLFGMHARPRPLPLSPLTPKPPLARAPTARGAAQRKVASAPPPVSSRGSIVRNAGHHAGPKKIEQPAQTFRGGVQQRVAPNSSRQTVQPFKSRTVQAVRLYPNLHPGAIEPVSPSSVFRLNSFADQYRLHRVNSHGVNVPNQQYNFVRTREGEMLLHNRYRHPSIAEGKQVLYAGEIFFNNGRLQWWSNGSGHYQPGADDAGQANLPLERFFSYQQIIKGEHTRKKM